MDAINPAADWETWAVAPTFSFAAAYAHLREADHVLGALIDQFGPHQPRQRTDPYAALVRAMLYQQLAAAGASAIQRRFYGLYGRGDQPPTPQELLATNDECLRSAGISRQKIGYLRDLALHVMDGRLNFDVLPVQSDEEVIRSLVTVKGIGEWTAHMFLMFQLGRPDVLPTGDLGVRRGMQWAYHLPGLPDLEETRAIGAPWAPYRSVGSLYMWRVAEAQQPSGAS